MLEKLGAVYFILLMKGFSNQEVGLPSQTFETEVLLSNSLETKVSCQSTLGYGSSYRTVRVVLGPNLAHYRGLSAAMIANAELGFNYPVWEQKLT